MDIDELIGKDENDQLKMVKSQDQIAYQPKDKRQIA